MTPEAKVRGLLEPAVEFDRAIPGADGHVSALFLLPDGRRVRVSVEPDGDVVATVTEGCKQPVYRDVPVRAEWTEQPDGFPVDVAEASR